MIFDAWRGWEICDDVMNFLVCFSSHRLRKLKEVVVGALWLSSLTVKVKLKVQVMNMSLINIVLTGYERPAVMLRTVEGKLFRSCMTES